MNIDELAMRINAHKAMRLWIDLTQCPQARLISERPGIYTASDLIKELQIRVSSALQSNISVEGYDNLRSSLENLKPDFPVNSYAIKDSQKTIFSYVNPESQEVIGLIVLSRGRTSGSGPES